MAISATAVHVFVAGAPTALASFLAVGSDAVQVGQIVVPLTAVASVAALCVYLDRRLNRMQRDNAETRRRLEDLIHRIDGTDSHMPDIGQIKRDVSHHRRLFRRVLRKMDIDPKDVLLDS